MMISLIGRWNWIIFKSLTTLFSGASNLRRANIFLIFGIDRRVLTVGRSRGFGLIIHLIILRSSIETSATTQ